jgi:hypothetical protein
VQLYASAFYIKETGTNPSLHHLKDVVKHFPIVLGFNLLGDALRDLLDPRSQGVDVRRDM